MVLDVGADEWVVPEDGVYSLTFTSWWQTASGSDPARVYIRCRVNNAITIGESVGSRWNTNLGNSAEMSFAQSYFLSAGDAVSFVNVSGSTITQGGTGSRTAYSIAKVGD